MTLLRHTTLLFSLLFIASVQSICPDSLIPCGDACYDPDDYCCPNGQLTQKKFCSATVTEALQTHCPESLIPCGDACYDANDYCCPNGQLTQRQFCNTPPPTTSAANITGKACNNPNFCANEFPAGMSCCYATRPDYTTPEDRCYQPEYTRCETDDAGNNNICYGSLVSCGVGCIDPSVFACSKGVIYRPSAAQPTGDNFVVDGSFEVSADNNTAWVSAVPYIPYKQLQATDNTHNGLYSIRFAPSGQIYQVVNAPAGKSLTLSFWLYTSKPSQYFGVHNNNDNVFSYVGPWPTNGWNFYSFQVTSSSDGQNKLIFSSEGSSWIYLDQVFFG